MREIQVIDWCDNAIHGETRVRATVIDLTLKVGDEEALVALCSKCHNLLDPVLDLMSNGVSTKPKKRAKRVDPEDTKCPDCGHESTTRSALGTHTRSQHGKGLKEYR